RRKTLLTRKSHRRRTDHQSYDPGTGIDRRPRLAKAPMRSGADARILITHPKPPASGRRIPIRPDQGPGKDTDVYERCNRTRPEQVETAAASVAPCSGNRGIA